MPKYTKDIKRLHHALREMESEVYNPKYEGPDYDRPEIATLEWIYDRIQSLKIKQKR